MKTGRSFKYNEPDVTYNQIELSEVSESYSETPLKVFYNSIGTKTNWDNQERTQ